MKKRLAIVVLFILIFSITYVLAEDKYKTDTTLSLSSGGSEKIGSQVQGGSGYLLPSIERQKWIHMFKILVIKDKDGHIIERYVSEFPGLSSEEEDMLYKKGYTFDMELEFKEY